MGQTCYGLLADPIPYDTEISQGKLRMVKEAENMLFELGFPNRVRIHGDLARLSACPDTFEKIIHILTKKIYFQLKKIDSDMYLWTLEGYRTGSSNPEK